MLLAIWRLLASIALLGLSSVPMLLLVTVTVLLRSLVALDLLRGWRIRRVAAVRVVALVVLALGRGAVALLLVLLVRVVGRRLVCALVAVSARFVPMRLCLLTCPWGGYGLCEPPY